QEGGRSRHRVRDWHRPQIFPGAFGHRSPPWPSKKPRPAYRAQSGLGTHRGHRALLPPLPPGGARGVSPRDPEPYRRTNDGAAEHLGRRPLPRNPESPAVGLRTKRRGHPRRNRLRELVYRVPLRGWRVDPLDRPEFALDSAHLRAVSLDERSIRSMDHPVPHARLGPSPGPSMVPGSLLRPLARFGTGQRGPLLFLPTAYHHFAWSGTLCPANAFQRVGSSDLGNGRLGRGGVPSLSTIERPLDRKSTRLNSSH